MPRYAPIVVKMYACDEVQQKRTVGYKSEQESKINAHSHNTANISAMQIWTTKRSQINGTHTHTQSMNIESAVREKLVTPKRSRKQIINYFWRRWRLIFPIFFALGRCTHAHSAAALFALVFYVILYTHSLSLVRRDLDTELSWTVFCLLVCYFRLFFLCMSEYGKINDMIKPSTIVYAQCAYTLISVFILFYVHFLY